MISSRAVQFHYSDFSGTTLMGFYRIIKIEIMVLGLESIFGFSGKLSRMNNKYKKFILLIIYLCGFRKQILTKNLYSRIWFVDFGNDVVDDFGFSKIDHTVKFIFSTINMIIVFHRKYRRRFVVVIFDKRHNTVPSHDQTIYECWIYRTSDTIVMTRCWNDNKNIIIDFWPIIVAEACSDLRRLLSDNATASS